MLRLLVLKEVKGDSLDNGLSRLPEGLVSPRMPGRSGDTSAVLRTFLMVVEEESPLKESPDGGEKPIIPVGRDADL